MSDTDSSDNRGADKRTEADSHNHHDGSGHIYDISSILVDASINYTILTDISNNTFFSAYDASCVDDVSLAPIHITDISSITVIDGSGYHIVTQDGFTVDGSFVINTTFNTTDPSFNIQITENLTETFTTYNDEDISGSDVANLMHQIQFYADEIKCSDFHGKGTIDDYTELFKAASQIANEAKQMDLNVDVQGFNEFASAADDLSNLFNGFIIKLQNVNIITDVTFLKSIVTALSKIVNLSKIFKQFKEVVFATSQVQIPKSTHDAAVIIKGVMKEINCAVEHIQYFVDPSSVLLTDADLSVVEKAMIAKSVDTINSWNVLCENGVSIAMVNDPDIQFIQDANTQLKSQTTALNTATAALKSKLSLFNLKC